MLSWLAMSIGQDLGIKNRIEPFQEIKKKKFPKDVLDKKLAQDLARADDDGFAIAKDNFVAQSTEQGSDCWSDLWRRIKAKESRLRRQKK